MLLNFIIVEFMKKNKLVYVLMYNDEVVAVCRSRAYARTLARTHVIELNYHVDRFEIKELPLL